MGLRRRAAIGDVHGDVAVLGRALDALKAESFDLTLCLGGVAVHPKGTERCCELLRELRAVG